MGMLKKIFNSDKQQLSQRDQDMLNDMVFGRRSVCPYCSKQDTPKTIIKTEDGLECCSRCGLPASPQPTVEELARSKARAKVFDRLLDAFMRVMFLKPEEREAKLKEYRDAFLKEVKQNDPGNELVIYLKGRQNGGILPIPHEKMFLDV